MLAVPTGNTMKPILLLVLAATAAPAQAPIPERTFGAPTAMGSEPLRNVAAIRELSDGRVILAQRGPYPAMVQAMIAGVIEGRDGRSGAWARGHRVRAERAAERANRDLRRGTQADHASGPSRNGPAQLPAARKKALMPTAGDSTLLVEFSRSEMLVIDPNGKVSRPKRCRAESAR